MAELDVQADVEFNDMFRSCGNSNFFLVLTVYEEYLFGYSERQLTDDTSS